MISRTIRRIVGVAVAASALGACGAAAFETVEQGQVRAWVVGSAEGSGEARIEGTVRWVAADRCWVLEPVMDDPTVDPHPLWQAIVWPKGTKVGSESPPTLVVAGQTVADGASIVGTGAGSDQVPPGLDIPPACRPDGLVLLADLRQ